MTSLRHGPSRPWTRAWLWALPAACLSCAASGPGAALIKEGDALLDDGRPEDALVAWDEAEAQGASASRLKSRRDGARSALVEQKIAEAERLQSEGDYAGGLALLVDAKALEPANAEIDAALQRQADAWVARAKELADSDQHSAALRALGRLEAVAPGLAGVAEARALITSQWTEILLNRARDAERTDRPAIALLNWAILAALNPDEPLFGEELDPLRKKVLDSLAVRTALFLGTMNSQMGLDPSVGSLRDELTEALAAGELSLEGVSWVERPFGEPGPSVTVAAVGEISASDVERGPGIYRVVQSTRVVANPERVALDARIRELEQAMADASRQMDRYQASYQHSEGPSRTKMAEAIERAQDEYDKASAEVYDLKQRRMTLPESVNEPTYTEYPVEDEVHSQRVEVTLEVRVSPTGEGERAPAYVVGRGEERDTLRMADPSRQIPEDPLQFTMSPQALRDAAVADALVKARAAVAEIPRQAAAQWLAHAERSERSGDVEEAARAYIHHVLLDPDPPAESALFFLAAQGLPSPTLIRGERAPLK